MITVRDLNKQFRLYQRPSDRLKEIVLRRKRHRDFQALDQVSFEVAQGETLGIVGPNGAGKSTLLKVLTGVTMPDSGLVDIQGRITGLLELGTGFNSEFTGIDNIFLNGTYLGLTQDEIQERLEAIVAFAELDQFIHEPIKTYSSGMVMRLAFSVAIHADPVCFVVDEALSVGDTYFQQKCIKRIRQFKDSGGAIVFVSHDMNGVKMLCDQVLLMHQGRILERGAPEQVIEAYNYLISRLGQEADDVPPSMGSGGYGSHQVRIAGTRLVNELEQETETLTSGRGVRVEITLAAAADTNGFNVGIQFRDRYGQDIFGTNTYHLRQSLSMRAGKEMRVSFAFQRFNLGPGKYTLTVAAHQEDTHVNDCLHWIDRALSFEVVHGGDYFFVGLARLEPELSVVARLEQTTETLPHNEEL
jgi:lipopolysaccharide transport system ATP-binding protein